MKWHQVTSSLFIAIQVLALAWSDLSPWEAHLKSPACDEISTWILGIKMHNTNAYKCILSYCIQFITARLQYTISMKGYIRYSIRVHLTRLRCSASLSWPAAWNPTIRKGTRDSIGDLHRSPNRCNVSVFMSSLHPLHVKSFTSIKKKEKRCAFPATKPPRRSSGTAVLPDCSRSPSQFAKTNWKPTSQWRVSWQAPVYHGWSFRILSDHIWSIFQPVSRSLLWDLLGLFVNEALCAVAIFDRFSSE